MLHSLDRLFAGRRGTRDYRRAEASSAVASSSRQADERVDIAAQRAADLGAAYDAEETLQAERLQRDTLKIAFLKHYPSEHDRYLDALDVCDRNLAPERARRPENRDMTQATLFKYAAQAVYLHDSSSRIHFENCCDDLPNQAARVAALTLYLRHADHLLRDFLAEPLRDREGWLDAKSVAAGIENAPYSVDLEFALKRTRLMSIAEREEFFVNALVTRGDKGERTALLDEIDSPRSSDAQDEKASRLLGIAQRVMQRSGDMEVVRALMDHCFQNLDQFAYSIRHDARVTTDRGSVDRHSIFNRDGTANDAEEERSSLLT